MPGEAWNEYWSEWVWPAEVEGVDELARKILGVAPTAGPAEIKAAYRSLARQLHPDTNPSDAALVERFKVIAEAYEILTTKRNKRTCLITTLEHRQGSTISSQPYPEWWLEVFEDMF